MQLGPRSLVATDTHRPVAVPGGLSRTLRRPGVLRSVEDELAVER